jgi:hypothetical protein
MTLSYFDYICYLYKSGNITEKEFVILKYRIKRIFLSPCVKNYLWNLYQFSKKFKVCCSFQHLIDYGFETGLIDFSKSMNEKDSRYKKYLNF